jgi:quinol monooxygenase YgiN
MSPNGNVTEWAENRKDNSMTLQDPRPMVFQLLSSIEPGVKLVETVDFKVDKKKEQRFLELVEGLLADSGRAPGIISFNIHKCLSVSEHHAEYLLYEVWKDRDGLKKQWESEFLKVFQGKLMTESLLVAPPDLKFFLH